MADQAWIVEQQGVNLILCFKYGLPVGALPAFVDLQIGPFLERAIIEPLGRLAEIIAQGFIWIGSLAAASLRRL